MAAQQPLISVGILTEKKIEFELYGEFNSYGMKNNFSGKYSAQLVNDKIVCTKGVEKTEISNEIIFEPKETGVDSFLIRDVIIGNKFHWQKKERERFTGSLKLIKSKNKIVAINILPIEDYLTSVISSEMSAKCPVEALKAHAVISRSWILSQFQKSKGQKSKIESNTERGRIPMPVQGGIPVPVPSVSQEDKGSDTMVPTNLGEQDEAEDQGEKEEPPETPDSIFPMGNPFQIRSIEVHRDRFYRQRYGRRSPSKTLAKSGRYVRSTSVRRNDDLALDATIRTAAPHQSSREKKGLAIAIETSDIREKVRERKIGNLLLFVVDASGSMGTILMSETKGAIFSLLLDAYKRRDKVGLVAFREDSAEILLPPTNSIELAKKLLEELPTGGKTPLVHGLVTGYQLIKSHLRKESQSLPIMILISDCRPNVPWHETPYYDYRYNEVGYPKVLEEVLSMAQYIQSEGQIKSLVIEVDDRYDHMSKGRDIAEAMGAQYFRIQDLQAKGIVRLLRNR